MKTGVIDKTENNRFKNKVKSLIDKAKIDYYEKLFKNAIGNARDTWRGLNEVMGRKMEKNRIKCVLSGGVEITDDKGIAETFNNYFHNIPRELDSKLPLTSMDPLEYINVQIESMIHQYDPCTSMEILSIISSIKITKQSKNSVPVRLLVANKDIISIPLSHLFNQCMLNGIFPDSYKIGRIVPILKKGNSRLVSNYRPISILPVLSKVFEKIIHKRLVKHLAENNILSPTQFGFRTGMSTIDAIVHFTEYIYEALNNKQSTINVFIDYSKAFDTVNHDILIRKLDRYGVRGTALEFTKSYLNNRKQFVSINGAYSAELTTNISIPQGSVLGPLLYLVYVDEIQNLSQNFIVTSFADDCTLSFIDNSINNLVTTCNHDLNIFKSWSNANRLTINIEKTNCILISNILDSVPIGSIKLDNFELDFILDTKYLGVIIDNQLKFDKHVNYICGKIAKSIGVLLRCKSYVPLSGLRCAYFSIIHPYILYCLPIFGAIYAVHLNPLKILQNRAIRIITGGGYYDNLNRLFKTASILRIDDLFKYSLACYAYKNQNELIRFTRNHRYPMRNTADLRAPMARLRSTEQSVLYNTINLWNELPLDLKNSRSYDSFKFKYKELLLSQYVD